MGGTSRPVCLVVDDDASIRELVSAVLEGDYTCLHAGAAAEAQRLLRERDDVALVLLDVGLAEGSQAGMHYLETLRIEHPEIAVVMLTGRRDPGMADRAFANGAYGYVVKPFGVRELQLAVKSALTRRVVHRREGQARSQLERVVAERTAALAAAVERLEAAEREVRASRRELVRRLGLALEIRDRDTGRHTERMSLYCELIARRGGLPSDHVERIRVAAPLHDVGKIGIPDAILRKTGPLTEEEFALIRTHPVVGARMLEGSDDPVIRCSAVIARTHHERLDGSGYPDRLRGTRIPLEGRIAAIADTFDAATSDRSYRPALPIADTLEIIRSGRGTLFDPALVDVFLGAEDEVRSIARNSSLPGITALPVHALAG
jgi:putative two-component system response regulator